MCCSSVSYAAASDEFVTESDAIDYYSLSLDEVSSAPFMLRVTSVDGDMALLQASNGLNVDVTLRGAVKFGQSSAVYGTAPSGTSMTWPLGYSFFSIDDYFAPSTSGSVYMNFDNEVYVDFEIPCDFHYTDHSTVDLICSSTWHHLILNAGNNGYLTTSYVLGQSASSYQVLVDGQPVTGKLFDWNNMNYSHLLERDNPSISSIGYRFFFDPYNMTTSGATQFNYYGLILYFNSSGLEINGMDTQSGLFSSIIEWLQNIRDGINGVIQSVSDGLSSVYNAIVSLPSRIAEAIQNLFVPSAADLEEINANWQTMLETKLGFVWQAGTELIAIANAVIDEMEGGSPYAFVFPGISFPQNGEELVILPEMEVSLENDFMDVVRPVLCSITIAISVIAFINTAESMLAAIVSGASYYQFLHRKE